MITSHARSTILVRFAATMGGFAAAAMMSAAPLPIARADAFTDIVNAVEGDYATGQTAFTTAFADFSSNEVAAGMAALFNGIDDDSLGIPNNLLLGTVEALTGKPITGSLITYFDVPTNYTEALTEAQSISATGITYLADGATAFGAGDYSGALFYDLFAVDSLTVYPVQELLLGVAASF